MTVTAPVVLAGSGSVLPAPRVVRRRVSAVPTLAARRLALSVRSPRSLIIPVMNPVLFALVLAPALAHTVANPGGRTSYMTFLALATVGLLIPLDALFMGIGVVVDRQSVRHAGAAGGADPPVVDRAGEPGGGAGDYSAADRGPDRAVGSAGAAYVTSVHLLWFLGAALVFSILMYSVAEILAVRLPSAEAYTGALPVVAIVPFFFAGSLFPITALPGWLDAVAKVLPLTHALALFRYGLTSHSGSVALHNIWGMKSAAGMVELSIGVIALYTVVAFRGAVRLFVRERTN